MFERFVKIIGTAVSRCLIPMCLAAICLAMWLMMAGAAQAQQGQQPPEAPKPAAAPAATQENPEVETPTRKVKPRNYKNWLFSVGGGANLPSGTTEHFVRGGGPVADVGAARNVSKYFGFRADLTWTDLPLRASALQLAQATGAHNQVYGLTFDPIVYIPATNLYSGYAFIGPGFFRRSGKIDSSTAVPGGSCNALWDWWGTCLNGSLPLGTFLKENQNEFGFNFGGGIARKVTDKIDLYTEYRAIHGSRAGNTTDARTLTLGVRW